MRGKKRFILALSALVLALLTVSTTSHYSPKASAQNTQNFTISSFDADYYLDREPNGTPTMRVTETIVAVFPDSNQNHGILRAIPQSYQDHTVSLKILSVRNPKGILKYTTYQDNDNLVLKIGDAATYVHGNQTYIIEYSMRNVISYQTGQDELYWDVNGDQWQQPFGSVTARIHVPQNISGKLHSQKVCYEGTRGTRNSSNCSISSSEDANGDQVILAESHYLQPGSTLTFVLGFNKGLFTMGPEVRQEKLTRYLFIAGIAAIVVVPPLIVFVLMYRRWRKFGKDPKGRGVIVPEYQPPKNFNPVLSDYVIHEKLRFNAITATIIDLAVRKYIAIFETEKGALFKKKTYELELLKADGDLTLLEKNVLAMFFGENAEVGKRIDLADLKNKLSKKVTTLEKELATILTAEGYFRGNPQMARKKYAGVGSIILVIGISTLFFLFFIAPISISLILCGLIILAFSSAMPSRSEKGVAVRDNVLGLKEYMKLAEADRINFLQSPEGAEKISAGIEASNIDPTKQGDRVKLFEKLLPYAMLFGIEKDWAKQFEDVYKEAPDWYHGNWSTFNAVYLANAIGGFSATNAVAFSAPSSSSSSGFGGGGFSGGGGGGGGGGGW